MIRWLNIFGLGKAPCDMAEIRLIVGLGNPGAGYDRTRHNAGFEVVDLFAEQFGVDVKKKKFGGLFGECIIGDKKVFLLKPQSYMNRSGQAVATALGFYKLTGAEVMVVTDDLALAPGRIRIRAKGSAGGHNGLKDIIARLGGEEFTRLRVGVGGQGGQYTKDYVLSRPPADERQEIAMAVAASVAALDCWISKGIDAAMNRYNVRNNDE
jgi:PTH1 family peptidyl-tRNA hydrolase